MGSFKSLSHVNLSTPLPLENPVVGPGTGRSSVLQAGDLEDLGGEVVVEIGQSLAVERHV